MPSRCWVTVAAVVLGCTVSVQAQEAAPPDPGLPTHVSLSVGVSTGSSATGVALGATFVARVARRLAVEAGATHLERGPGLDGEMITGGALFSLGRWRGVAPYAAIGAGLYRAAFDTAHPAWRGAIWSSLAPPPDIALGGPPTGCGTTRRGLPVAGCTGWTSGAPRQIPEMYERRLMQYRGSGVRAFVDPAILVGGGLRIDIGPAFFIRPDVRVVLAAADGTTAAVTVINVNLAARF